MQHSALPPLPGESEPPLPSSRKGGPPARPLPSGPSPMWWVAGAAVVVGGLAWALWPSAANAAGSQGSQGQGGAGTGQGGSGTGQGGSGGQGGPGGQGGQGGGGPGTQGPSWPPADRLAAEAEECTAVVASKPQKHGDRVRPGYMPDDEWFALVAYWRVYPDGPVQPEAVPAFAAALGRIRSCVRNKLPMPDAPKPTDPKPTDPKPDAPKPDVQNEQPATPAELPGPLADKPTPGRAYQLQHNKPSSLLLLASQAYGTPEGSAANLQRAHLINNHPYNRRFHVAVEAEKGLFPPSGERISFMPIFGTPEQQAKDVTKGARGEGDHYAVVYVPEIELKVTQS